MNRLIQQRGFCKGQITRAHATVAEVVEGSTSVETLEYRLGKLNANYERFIELSALLCTHKDEPDYIDPATDVVEYEEKHFYTHSVFSEALNQLRKETKPYAVDITVSETSIECLVSSQTKFLEKLRKSSNRTELHLEKIKIPTFSGNYVFGFDR